MPDSPPPALAPEDFYFDGPFLVFTATYLRKRGYCCGNGCRHCPYDEQRQPSPEAGEPPASVQ